MSERRLRSFLRTLEGLGETAWLRNIKTDEFYVTPGFWEGYGYEPSESPKGRSDFARLIHPADISRVTDASARFLAGETDVLDLELRISTKARQWRWLHLRGREVIRTLNGQPHIAAGILTDVDDFRRAQVSALEDHERLMLALQSSGAGLWELELPSFSITLDRRSLEMHGLALDTQMPIPHERWIAAIDAEHRDATVSAFRDAVAHGAFYSAEYSTRGGRTWINGLGKAISDQQGEPRRFIGLNLDISARKESERLIKEMQAELLHSTRASAMGTMAATLAHELNQPLTAIANYASGALRLAGASGDPRLLAALKATVESAHRAGKIIRQMRQMARTGEPEFEELRFDQLMLEAFRHAKFGCEGTSFHLDLNDNAVVRADAIQIQQVVMNLVRNACQAMEGTAGSQREVIIATENLPNAVKVTVSDAGPGIPEALISSIFEANVTTKQEGMGLGLSISRTIIEAHGGTIWAESKPDGSDFCFTLPAIPDRVSAPNEDLAKRSA